jgi:hypothetical protein
MKRSVVWIAFLALATLSFAQESPNSVSFESAAPVIVAPGHTAQVTMIFKVGGAYHINSHKPLDELLIPTEVKLSPPTEIMISKISYPRGEELNFPFSPDTKLSVYSGQFKVTAAVRPTQNAPHGTFRVHGDLKFQACTDRQCFPPKKIPVQFDVQIQKAKRSRRG